MLERKIRNHIRKKYVLKTVLHVQLKFNLDARPQNKEKRTLLLLLLHKEVMHEKIRCEIRAKYFFEIRAEHR